MADQNRWNDSSRGEDSEAFRIMDIRLFELCTRPLDILLHEQKFLHSCELLGVSWARQSATQVVDR